MTINYSEENDEKKNSIFMYCFCFSDLDYTYIYDSQRLKNQTSAEKPIICIFEKATGEEIVYYGLGYSVHYELTNDSVCSSTFYLLNIIVLWGWIE